MQTSKENNLAKKTRYYQDISYLNSLAKSEDFNSLHDSMIIC